MGKRENEIDKIRLANFKKAMLGMVAATETAYSGNRGFKRAADYTSYTKEEIIDIINSGKPEELRDLSISFFYSSGFYRRFCLYYGTFLKYTPIIIPHMVGGDKEITEKKYEKRYHNSLEFYNNMNFEKLCTDFSIKTIVEGAYYGMVIDNGKTSIGLQPLPYKFCRSRFKTYDGVDIVEFDLRYFDNIRDKNERDAALNNFPMEIRKAYNSYKNKNTDPWFMLQPGQGVHFNLYEERPFMLNVIPAIMDFEEYREIEKEKDTQELKKILVQEMPHTADGELVFDPEEVEEMHVGTVNMIKRNKDVDVLTSFGKVSLAEMQSARSVISNNLEKIERTIYSEAGVSKEVFSADNAAALEKSLKSDLSLMMYLASAYETWLAKLLNERFSDSKMYFTVKILPLSYYDSYEFIEKTLNMAQYGYSFLVPSLAIGINQMELHDIKNLENNLLNLHESLIPLQSSHTQSQSAGSEEKKEEEKSEEQNEENLEGAPSNPEEKTGDEKEVEENGGSNNAE